MLMGWEDLADEIRRFEQNDKVAYIDEVIDELKGYNLFDLKVAFDGDVEGMILEAVEFDVDKNTYSRKESVHVSINMLYQPWTARISRNDVENLDDAEPLSETTIKGGPSTMVAEVIVNFHKYWYIDRPRRMAEEAAKEGRKDD